MVNPFAEDIGNEADELELIERAKEGDRAALEKLLLRHQAWVFNIAVRMVFQPEDAAEVTQEVLIKIVTRLSTFQGKCRFRTWLYRIAVNHVLNMRRRRRENEALTFAAYGDAINGTPDSDLPDPNAVPVEVPVLVEETKNACTLGMLLCLDRKQRLVFTLGAILGASDTVGAEVLEITPDNFRQLLARARRDLHSFMNNQCGLVNANNPCSCAKKTKGFIQGGHVDPHNLMFVPQQVQRVRDLADEAVRDIDDLVERQHVEVFREHPFLQTPDQIAWLRRILDDGRVRAALHLN
jgi:RNA polymerase sigma factor (sigma-70 family)